MKCRIANVHFILIIVFSVYPICVFSDYWSDRETLIQNDQIYAMGSNLKLTTKEKRVNDILMSYKVDEYDAGFANPNNFAAGQHFFKAKEKIEKSKVFDVIKSIPKGASLHSHDEALVSQEYLYRLTFTNNLYGCVQEDDIQFHFFSENNVSTSCNWRLVSEMRESDPKFDEFLKSKLSLITDDPDSEYRDINTVWKRFQKTFVTVGGLISFRPVFEKYFYQALKELYEDNIKYMEVRGFLPEVYDLNGKTYSPVEVVNIYATTLKVFQRDYPDFFGARFIYAPHRLTDNRTMDEYLKVYREISSSNNDFVAGFDLVGQEDLGQPLISFLPELLELKQLGTKFFFHAGETDWYGESTDFNIFDAILLNTTRIGHGYAILKHPLAAKLIKQKQIAIEICPISNQVLKLVADLRNHPGTILIANNYPLVIASDDPSFWGAKGLSYDWYMAFMAMTSKETDLRFLKQLAMNSIEYSSLDDIDKNLAMAQWERDWNVFIERILIRHKYFFKIDPQVYSIN